MLKDDIIENGCANYKTFNFAGFYKRYAALYHEIKNATSYLGANATTPQRIWHILHGTEIPLCLECQVNQVKWESTKKEYTKYCSVKCSRGQVSAQIRSTAQHSVDQDAASTKRRQTILKTHESVEAFYDSIKEKRIKTMVENHGVEYTAQSSELRTKMQHTCIEKFGTSTPMKLDAVKSKQRQTNTDRYGSEFHQLSDAGRVIRKETNNKMYGGDTPFCSSVVRSKGKRTMVSTYGVANPSLSPDLVAKRNDTIKRKYNRNNINQIHLTEHQLQLLSDVDFLRTKHHVDKCTLLTIASDIGVDPKTVANRMNTYGIEIKRYQQSAGEREIAAMLTTHNIEYETSNRTLISPYELDIIIPQAKIAIEYCGLYWHSDIHPRITPSYHSNKRIAAEKAGYQLLTIFEDEWVDKSDIITSMLLHKTHNTRYQPIYGRHCTVKEITKPARADFLNKHHIQSDGRGSISLGLFKETELVGVMTFIRHKNEVYELNRFASNNVVGGFSKLLTYFNSTHSATKILSYADLRYSVGGVYKANGFKEMHDSRPSYSYISDDKKNRLHRSKFRRCNLDKMLSNYDSELTEFDNCDNHGILRIWDCGLRRFEFTPTV